MIIIPILWILLISLSISIILQEKMSKSIPLSFIGTSLLIIAGGYLGDLRIGVLLTLLLIPTALTLIVKKKIINKINITNFLKQNGVVISVFVLLFVYLCLYHSPSYFNSWDEFSHWGPMVRGMYNNNKLYSYLNINNAHPDYPPLFQCVEWLFCYLSGSYSETYIYIGLGIFTFSLFLPLLTNICIKQTKEQIKYALLFVILVFCIVAVDYQMYIFLQAIELDMSMGIVAGVCAYMIINYENNRNNNMLIVFYLIAILLTKEIGLAFYLISLILIVSIRIITNKEKDIVRKMILYVVIPVTIFISWKLYVKGLNPGQFSLSKINLVDTVKLLLGGNGESWQIIVRDSFLLSLFTKNLFGNCLPSSPFFQVFLVLLFGYVLFNHKYNKKYEIPSAISLVLSAGGYIFTMFVLYEACFSVEEATGLASYSRYFSTFILFLITLIVSSVYSHCVCLDNNKNYYLIIGLVGALLFVSNSRITMLIRNGHKVSQLSTDEFKTFAKQIEIENFEKTNTLIIDQTGLHAPMASYYFYKNVGFGYHILQEQYDKDTFINLYKNKYDYVYVWKKNDGLDKIWNQLKNDKLEESKLYKVKNDTLIKQQ